MKTTTRIADELAVPVALRPFAEVHLSGPRPIAKVAELLAIPGLIAHIDVREIVACAVALRTAAPHDRLVWTLTAGVLDRRVPNWHWDMVSDKRRNEVYEVAAQALIEPGMTVLEIGTGTGILAMIAARAEAKHVYTIEMNPRMAYVARASIAKNGYADRITVIESDALNVSVGDQLPHRADAIIHEIISTNVVSENVLELIGHAKEALLVPDPLLLPDEVWAMGQLGAREPQYPLSDVSGFDLNALDLMEATARHVKSLRPDQILGPPARLFGIDLNAEPPNLSQSCRVTLAADTSGTLTGVAQWPSFRFPDGTVFDGSEHSSCWGRLYHALHPTLDVEVGQEVSLQVDQLPSALAISHAAG
ncbi:MAG: 50S ribosomal protein L11 methyltransferase [Pseudomonadota bacterium]